MPEPIKKLNVQNFRDQVIDMVDKDYTDWHSKGTIIFGSLVEDGFDWGYNDWKAYNISEPAVAILRPRLKEKIEDRFFFRELGILPPANFRRNLKSRLEEAVAEQGWLYQAIFDGLDFTMQEKESLVEIEVNSEFPQVALRTEEQDYASDSQQNAHDKVYTKPLIEGLNRFYASIGEPDAKVLKHIDQYCFSQLLSFNF